MFNAKIFNPHKKLISLLNVPICTQGMQRTWWPEADTIIVTEPYLSYTGGQYICKVTADILPTQVSIQVVSSHGIGRVLTWQYSAAADEQSEAVACHMKPLWHENAFCVTGPLRREANDLRCIPLTKGQ